MEVSEFKINQVIPIGLDGEGQRPMHTNVIGQILIGSIKMGDLVSVPLINGSVMQVAVKGLMIEWGSSENPFPEILSADIHGKLTCGMSLRIPPNEADQIDSNGVIWFNNTEAVR